jgi:hypothetical protein
MIDTLIQDLMRNQNIPGLACGVMRGKTILHEGHNGGIAGFASALLHFRETQTSAVVLCNWIDEPHDIALKVIETLTA